MNLISTVLNYLTEVAQSIFKIALTFMSGVAKLQHISGFSQNTIKIPAKAGNVPGFIIPQYKWRGYFKHIFLMLRGFSYLNIPFKYHLTVKNALVFLTAQSIAYNQNNRSIILKISGELLSGQLPVNYSQYHNSINRLSFQ